MPKEVVNGIVLRTVDYRESDRILTVLTKERGLITVTARGCRKPSSKLAAFACQFCFGEMEVSERAGKLQLSSATVDQSFYPIRESYEQLYSASQIVKITERTAARELANDELFLLVFTTLSVIAYGENDPKDAELCFLAKLLRISGYSPVLTSCVKCGRDLRARSEIGFSCLLGGSVCEHCGTANMTVSALTMEALRRMLLVDVNDMRRVRLPDAVRSELAPLLYNYAEYVFELALRL